MKYPGWMSMHAAVVVALLLVSVAAVHPAPAQKAPAGLQAALESGKAVDAIIEFDGASVDAEAAQVRALRKLRFDDAAVLSLRAQRYRGIKDRVFAAVPAIDLVRLRDYSHLPLAHVRLNSAAALARLQADAAVVAIHPDGSKFPVLDAISAGLVGQPAAQALGLTGQGVAVAVIDSGVDYTQPDFGPCTAPGAPANCRVAYLANLADSSTTPDTSPIKHGTNVAGIVAGVAPGAKIAALNVFGASASASDSVILSAINWAIANQAAYNIHAINMSLGDGSRNTAPCSLGNPYRSAITNARNAGILTVAAAGNEGYTDAIANPACTPNAVSVGAVYSRSWGQVTASVCTDATTTADQVCCFSDSATFLTMLAPGAFITAGGVQQGGTSQAAPFVTGAIAVERAAYPGDTLDQTLLRLTSHAASVTDSRNGIVKPRLSLYSAVRPVNDDFANRSPMTGGSGSVSGTDVHATKEAGEPNHAGSTGGQSVWWNWVAPAAGQVSLNTHGSDFDTLLAVYIGTSVAALTAIASNNDDGTAGGGSGLVFQAQAGTEYKIAVDSASGASGNATLAWSENTAASANLAVTLNATPGSLLVGGTLTYDMGAINNGPQTATDARATLTLPAATIFSSASNGCTRSNQVVTCQSPALPAGAAAAWSIVVVATAAGTLAATASVTSDVPDLNSEDNTASASATALPGAGTDGDVPLPLWALVLLGGALLSIGFGVSRSSEGYR